MLEQNKTGLLIPDRNKIVTQARMLKKANVHVEEDLSKRTRENRAELRKFMRQVNNAFTQDHTYKIT